MNLHRLVVFFLLLLTPPGLHARTINWGDDVGSTLYDSTGALLDDSFVFELGSFGSFLPTEFNLIDWVPNWKPFDRAAAPAGSGWNSAAAYFTSSASLLTDGTSSEAGTWSLPGNTFSFGEQAYIWVYNSQTLVPDVTEWALLTNGFDGNAADNWIFPSPADQTGLPLDWRLNGATFTPFGGILNTQGPGDHPASPGTFDLQTHTSPVPEPGTALLVALAFGIRCFNRRR